MDTQTILSINAVPIRFGAERWLHISLGHPEMVDFYDEIFQTVAMPEQVYAGKDGELIAVRSLDGDVEKKIVVIYKETRDDDGFIITAYLTKRIRELQKRILVWPLLN
jgi:hypothetical protein